MRTPGHTDQIQPKGCVLFDLEGTLVDFQWNLEGAARAAREELGPLGIDASGWPNHYAALWNGAVQAARERGLDHTGVAARINAIYEPYDLDALSRWSLLPGVRTVLPLLKDVHRVRLGLVTNIGKRAVDAAMVKFGLAELFDVSVTRSDVEWVKPSGQGIGMALGKLGVTQADALFVGDSESDILAARDAGIPVAIVKGGENAPASLLAAGPDGLWESLEELGAVYSREPGSL